MTTSERYLSVAVDAAHAGGRILRKNLGILKRADVMEKGRFDWVTSIDHASEKAIIRVIKKSFPTHTIKAEESAPKAQAAAEQWIIDPLDGTVNFIHSFPMFCVSIALMREGKLEVGVIYDPVRKELFTTRRGHGARLNGRRIRVDGRPTLKGALLATGFPFRAQDQLDPYLESFRRILLKTGSIRRAGSAALDLAYTACGRFTGFWEMGLSPWDMAAGVLLVQEAGGKVSDFFGKNSYLESGHVLVANPAIHRKLIGVLAPIFRGKL